MKISYDMEDFADLYGRQIYSALHLELRLSDYYHYQVSIDDLGRVTHKLKMLPDYARCWPVGKMGQEQLAQVMAQERSYLGPVRLRLLDFFNHHLTRKLGRRLYRTLRFLPSHWEAELTVRRQQIQVENQRDLRTRFTSLPDGVLC